MLMFDFSGLTADKMFDLLFVVVIFLIVDFFDGMSTIVGVGRDAGIIDKDGKVPNARSALVADAGWNCDWFGARYNVYYCVL